MASKKSSKKKTASKKSAQKPSKKKTAKKTAKKTTKKKVAKKTATKKAVTKKKAAVIKKVKTKPEDVSAKPPKKKRAKSKKSTKEHYVNSKEFYEQIKLYYETDVIPDELSISLVKIATGLSFAPNFINYSYKDEMIGDAVLKMFSAIRNKKFDIETKNNPFSYFTTIAFHAFINRIKKEKKHRETITKYQETFYSDTLNNEAQGQVYVDPTNPEQDD